MSEFKDIKGGVFGVSTDSNPYRITDGEAPRVVLQGKDFFLELSPETATRVARELFVCSRIEQEKVTRDLERRLKNAEEEVAYLEQVRMGGLA